MREIISAVSGIKLLVLSFLLQLTSYGQSEEFIINEENVELKKIVLVEKFYEFDSINVRLTNKINKATKENIFTFKKLDNNLKTISEISFSSSLLKTEIQKTEAGIDVLLEENGKLLIRRLNLKEFKIEEYDFNFKNNPILKSSVSKLNIIIKGDLIFFLTQKSTLKKSQYLHVINIKTKEIKSTLINVPAQDIFNPLPYKTEHGTMIDNLFIDKYSEGIFLIYFEWEKVNGSEKSYYVPTKYYLLHVDNSLNIDKKIELDQADGNLSFHQLNEQTYIVSGNIYSGNSISRNSGIFISKYENDSLIFKSKFFHTNLKHFYPEKLRETAKLTGKDYNSFKYFAPERKNLEYMTSVFDVINESNNIILIGKGSSYDGFYPGDHRFVFEHTDLWTFNDNLFTFIIKLDSSGNLIWNNSFYSPRYNAKRKDDQSVFYEKIESTDSYHFVFANSQFGVIEYFLNSKGELTLNKLQNDILKLNDIVDFTDVTKLNDNTIVLFGYKEYEKPGFKHNVHSYFISKLIK